ncbi:aspartate-semialdehyde dehydrogenase [Arenimonas composti]|uniref:Aspartate-semialdehyde dehydrogenase n=1 Tax=Arenimonas composti TR7-09 = DSM 18010 TaxID=1121013 RepID=A0A091BDX8_9GAMM|nr:semialdehyde dehydrogenase [Arenimonas composti TR7-09 = DSM 18010]
MSSRYNVAVVGATGAVGEAMLAILAERGFPVGELHLLASERSAGETVEWNGRAIVVRDLADFDPAGIDIALFSAGAGVSKKYAPKFAAAGAVVIDNSSAFRYDDDVPLVVAEVNPEQCANRPRGIIANPNCSTMQMLVALAPLHRAAGIERINVCTYQSVSGAGRSGMEELGRQTAAMLNFQPHEPAKFPVQIAFNLIPHIDEFLENGFTKEEMKMVWETRKILGDEAIGVNPTAVRVPVFFGHSEAVHIETKRRLGVDEARELLAAAPGVEVIDEREPGGYPTPVTHAAGTDAVYVGRLREDPSHPRGLDLWIVSDNIRKGAALNAVQLAEIVVNERA